MNARWHEAKIVAVTQIIERLIRLRNLQNLKTEKSYDSSHCDSLFYTSLLLKSYPLTLSPHELSIRIGLFHCSKQ